MCAVMSNQTDLHFDIQIKHNHIQAVWSLKNIPNICNKSNHKRIRIPHLYLLGCISWAIRAHSAWDKKSYKTKHFQYCEWKLKRGHILKFHLAKYLLYSYVIIIIRQIWHCLYIGSICSHGHQRYKASGRLNNMSLALKQEIQNNVRTVTPPCEHF